MTEKESITVDHVVPRSWYPETATAEQVKWKVPCCKECNNRFSRIEKNLLERIGLCLDPSDPITRGIPQRAIRALTPPLARNDKDRVRRAVKREVIRSEMHEANGKPLKGALPFFGPRSGDKIYRSATVKISEKEIKEFGCKLIKGMLYVTGGYLIGPEYKLKCYINTEESDRNMFREFYENHGRHHLLAPGIEAFIIPSEKPPASLFRFKIWNRLILHGAVILATDISNEDESD